MTGSPCQRQVRHRLGDYRPRIARPARLGLPCLCALKFPQPGFVSQGEWREINFRRRSGCTRRPLITFVAAIFGADSPTVELLSPATPRCSLHAEERPLRHDGGARSAPRHLDAFLSDPPRSIEMPLGSSPAATDGFFEWRMPTRSNSDTKARASLSRGAREISGEIIANLHQEVLRLQAHKANGRPHRHRPQARLIHLFRSGHLQVPVKEAFVVVPFKGKKTESPINSN